VHEDVPPEAQVGSVEHGGDELRIDVLPDQQAAQAVRPVGRARGFEGRRLLEATHPGGEAKKDDTLPPRPAAKTSRPKSFSSASRMRPSSSASLITVGSFAPLATSATATTSWPTVRSARTTQKSQLSSARKRIQAQEPVAFFGEAVRKMLSS